jgi:IMP dehydrogenase
MTFKFPGLAYSSKKLISLLAFPETDKMKNDYIDKFMATFKYEGLTFDDVSLITQYADFLPHESSVVTRFTRNVKLNIPYVSAAMDTVTESEMAIAMARMGGIGVLHKNLREDIQAEEVRKVKHYLNGLISDPVVFHPEQTIADMIEEKEKKNYSFSGFPVVENDGKLIGILTARDVKFLTDYTVKIKDVMSSKLVTAPIGTQLETAFGIMLEHKIGKLPLVDKKGCLAGIYSFFDVKTLIENVEPDYNRDERHQLRVAAAIGPYNYDRADALAGAGVDVLVIDTAHGHSKGVVDTVEYIKKKYSGVDVVAGNIATGEAAKRLMDAGADAVKVGIGPGSICTTRVVAGVGVPQVSAVYEVSRAVGNEIPVIADGGIKQSGDVAKAIAVGASSVMMGSALAGTQESPGEKILHHGRSFVLYRGMGSLEAMKQASGSRERYGQRDVDDEKKLVPQGIEGMVPYRGAVNDVICQFLGGLRYSLGYCGTRTIPELQNSGKLVRVSGAGLKEAHPHDVTMLKDAPNYAAGS